MSAALPVRRSTDRMDERTKIYKRYVNTGIMIFVLLMVIFAGSGFAISTKVEAHSQAISADRAILKFICEDMQNEDSMRAKLHVVEKTIQPVAINQPYWDALNVYMNQQETNAHMRQQKCAQLAKDSQ